MRRDIRRATRPAALFVLAAALLAGCDSSVVSPSPVQGLIAVPTQPPPAGGGPQACMAALLTGVLVADERWGIVVAPPDGGPVIKVIWPFGYAGRVDGGGIALVDLAANGAVVARVGDRVEIGGGMLSGVDNAWFACGGVTAVPNG